MSACTSLHIDYAAKYILNSQARVKTDRDLSSDHITDLPAGSLIEIECKVGDRLKICAPINGWISAKCKNGQLILSKASKADEMDWEVRLDDLLFFIAPHQPPNWVFDVFLHDYPVPVQVEQPKVEEEVHEYGAEDEWNEWSKELKAAEMMYEKALRGCV